VKIAVATEDGSTVAQHFGRAPKYRVLTVVNGRVTERELRPKAGHQTFAGGPEPTPGEKHAAMIDAVADCTAVIAGGMGPGARRAIQTAGLSVVLTGVTDADAAAVGFATGEITSDPDRTCDEGGGHSH
jgi:predicted Fe-Mo cluster-binding NifX family protein